MRTSMIFLYGRGARTVSAGGCCEQGREWSRTEEEETARGRRGLKGTTNDSHTAENLRWNEHNKYARDERTEKRTDAQKSAEAVEKGEWPRKDLRGGETVSISIRRKASGRVRKERNGPHPEATIEHARKIREGLPNTRRAEKKTQMERKKKIQRGTKKKDD